MCVSKNMERLTDAQSLTSIPSGLYARVSMII